MPITYGVTLSRAWGEVRLSDNILMKAYAPHTEKSEVFLSYRYLDQDLALQLAAELDRMGRHVFIDLHDNTLQPGDINLDKSLITAINNADTMVIVVSDDTQGSWWVPWEIGVSTPYQKPRAMFKLPTSRQLPAYLARLPRFSNSSSVNRWVIENC